MRTSLSIYLQKIVGRDTDVVHTPGGKALIVHFFTGVFEHLPQIKQFRIIQKKVGEIEIEFIPSETFSQTYIQKNENL